MGSLQFPALDQAIAQFEGYNTPGTVAARNYNPGNIICGTFAAAHGSTGCETLPSGTSFATFPNPATGSAAQDALVSQYANQGATLSSLINSWAPPNAPGNSPQATQNYVNSVAQSLGVDPLTPVSNLSGIGTSGSTTSPGSILGSIFGTTPLGLVGSLTGNAFSFARLGSFLLGLILIAGGIFLFRPVQTVVKETVRTGKQLAGVAAF